jgi:hypothetical protein
MQSTTNGKVPWRVLSSHGAMLFHIARHPGCTSRDIAGGLCVTERTVWNLLADLRQAGLIDTDPSGVAHRYWISEEACLPDPQFRCVSLGEIAAVMPLREDGELPCCRQALTAAV